LLHRRRTGLDRGSQVQVANADLVAVAADIPRCHRPAAACGVSHAQAGSARADPCASIGGDGCKFA